jgi:hypothetical protein
VTRSGPSIPLAKSVWSEADFEQMGWHDNAVHAFALEPTEDHPGRLLVDLDYIVEWVKPVPPESNFTFWMSPATLVVDPAWGISLNVELVVMAFELSLNAILRSGPDEHGRHRWQLEGHDFNLTVKAKGYRQYLRQRPIHAAGPRLSVEQRGGLSFEERGFEL